MNKLVLPAAVKINADLATLTGYAKHLKIKLGKGAKEQDIAGSIIGLTNDMSEEDWGKMATENEALAYFINDINTQLQELPAETLPEGPAEGGEGEEDP